MPWFIVALIRLIAPLSVIPFSFLGSLIGVIADNLDIVFLELLRAQNISSNYNLFDKLLDNYFYFIQGYTTLKWTNKPAKYMGWFLLFYRTIGTILFELTHNRTLLFIFPNLFVTFYIFTVGYKAILKKDPFPTTKRLLIITFILLIPKLYQEYLFHVAQFPLYQTLKSIYPF